MSNIFRACFCLTIFFPLIPIASAQESPQLASANSRSIHLNVVVTSKSGAPVTELEQHDFTLTDNKSTQPITSFKVVSKDQEPVKVILIVDAVNARYSDVANQRQQVEAFLRSNDGSLAQPTTLAVLTDQGTQMQKDFTRDGNALSDSLAHYAIGLREITRNTGIWGANDRVQISLTALRQLISYGTTVPGRKIVLWVSPGWPLLSGAHVDLDSKQQQQIFNDVVMFSTQLRQANMTLYNINPIGAGENFFQESYFHDFEKGISKPAQTDVGDLSLQVLAVQSGGLTIQGNNDITAMLKKCVSELESWYEITFDPRSAERPNEYHHIGIILDKPGLIARTRDGYYAQP
jgi:VWFA-related protein